MRAPRARASWPGAPRAAPFRLQADHLYALFFVFTALLVATAPLLRYFGRALDYDRIMDGSIVLLCLIRLADGPLRVSKNGLALLAAIVGYFTLCAGYDYTSDPGFQPTLLLLEIKLILFSIALYLFQDVRIGDRRLRRFLVATVFAAFFIGSLLFALFPSMERLKLLNESNYTMIAMVIVAHVLVMEFNLKFPSPALLAVFAIVFVALVLSQSRTGFAATMIFYAFHLYRKGSPIRTALVTIAIVLGSAAAYGLAAHFLARGQDDVEDIDRVRFVLEYVEVVKHQSLFSTLFSANVGSYVSDTFEYMKWWVVKQAQEKDIPVGLAPFNFHSAYLRLLAAYGIVMTLVICLFMLKMLGRTYKLVPVVIFLAGTSMSVFYLSSVIPFVLLAFLIGPSTARRRPASAAAARSGMPSPLAAAVAGGSTSSAAQVASWKMRS